mmetsp:Transcript_2674/g.4106  ORF Transcript_2674/g.4106 Transcript_2674/m.4106 type:complete len:391 (+) Transcript_2674:149-1321(+)|eukprot:CAMPEP_0184660536 /NCGR_PEP_ID=MMETSP0308-20130426/34331_1 /TAXON_ID=38269 /ORGANISM="Gloeochaete witrockiana, Strain SAG 46.84" /LENGTH=390 /DNA_ID=CAMNT_0027101199 /DNA_START=45 /DNA_END=1217 /DNA_ORIENTATION=-
MHNLLNGILEFREKVLPYRRNFFKELVDRGQHPDCFIIACSDSRVAPNLFASTNPGESFVHRCVGNLIPVYGPGHTACTSEGAAIEYAVTKLNVDQIIVCGHSECGAINTFLTYCNRRTLKTAGDAHLPYNLSGWIEHAAEALVRFMDNDYADILHLDESIPDHNKLAMLNVLVQMEHLYSYPDVEERVQAGTLGIHGWYFDIGTGDVMHFDRLLKRFVCIDKDYCDHVRNEMNIITENKTMVPSSPTSRSPCPHVCGSVSEPNHHPPSPSLIRKTSFTHASSTVARLRRAKTMSHPFTHLKRLGQMGEESSSPNHLKDAMTGHDGASEIHHHCENENEDSDLHEHCQSDENASTVIDLDPVQLAMLRLVGRKNNRLQPSSAVMSISPPA